MDVVLEEYFGYNFPVFLGLHRQGIVHGTGNIAFRDQLPCSNGFLRIRLSLYSDSSKQWSHVDANMQSNRLVLLAALTGYFKLKNTSHST